MRTILLLGVALVLGLAGARASECVPSTSEPEVTLPFGLLYGSKVYVDNDLCQFGCLFSVWYYEESNDIDGLQRGDEVVDDTCGGMIPSDAWQF